MFASNNVRMKQVLELLKLQYCLRRYKIYRNSEAKIASEATLFLTIFYMFQTIISGITS